MYPKSPPGVRQNGQTAPPCTRGDHSANWRRSMCPTPVTHLVVKFPTPGQSKAVKSPVVFRGGGGGVELGLQLIGALRRDEGQFLPLQKKFHAGVCVQLLATESCRGLYICHFPCFQPFILVLTIERTAILPVG